MHTLDCDHKGLARYLMGSVTIDLDNPAVRAAHAEIVRGSSSAEDEARRSFLYVRDQIRHSWDAGDHEVTLRASEVLAHRTGLCFAKAHLATAFLRLSGIPTGLCYQRLRNGQRLMLHGLIAIHMAGGWHRQDVRGNRPGLHAEFSLDKEILAFTPDSSAGEEDLPDLLVDPAPAVVRCLTSTTDIAEADLPSGIA